MSWGSQVLSFRLEESGAPWLGVVGFFNAPGAEAQREKTIFWNHPQTLPTHGFLDSWRLWESAPCSQLPSCPMPGPDAGRWAHCQPPTLLPLPSLGACPSGQAQICSVWLSLKLGNPTAGEEGNLCPASLPTQQLRPPGRVREGTQPPFPGLCLPPPRPKAVAPARRAKEPFLFVPVYFPRGELQPRAL